MSSPSASCAMPMVTLTRRPPGMPSKTAASTQPLGRGARALHLGAGKDQQEFLAAEAPEHVQSAQGRCDDRGQLPEHRVARGVAVAVVDRLEVIDVDQAHRHRRAQARGARMLARQRFEQEAPVVDAGQLVAHRDLGDLVEGLPEAAMAVREAHAQPVDVAAHHREPGQHDHQHGELGERGHRVHVGLVQIRKVQHRAVRRQPEQSETHQPRDAEAQHAEQHRHRVEQRQRFARLPGVVHDVGEEQDRGADLLGGKAGIGEAPVEAAAENRVEQHDQRRHAGRALERDAPGQHAEEGADEERHAHQQRGARRHQEAPYAQRLALVGREEREA
jgi:hypothetical protein